jgi:hypothetical protein
MIGERTTQALADAKARGIVAWQSGPVAKSTPTGKSHNSAASRKRSESSDC